MTPAARDLLTVPKGTGIDFTSAMRAARGFFAGRADGPERLAEVLEACGLMETEER